MRCSRPRYSRRNMKASAPSIAPVLNTYVCDCAGRIKIGVCPCERTVVVIDPVVPGGTAQRVKQVRIPKTRHVVLGRRIDRRKGHYVQDGLGIVREGDRPVIGRYTPEPLEHALSRNQIAESPLKRIAKRERPKQKAKPRRRLSDEECAKLIEHSLATYRALNATYAFTGMRQSEPLGLTWEDIDFESERICVRYQLARKKRGEPVRRVSLKSDNGVREIELLPELASML